jgi:hypothetical protein
VVRAAKGKGVEPKNLHMLLRSPTLKPLVMSFMLSGWKHLRDNPEIVLAGWRKPGLLEAWTAERQKKALKLEREGKLFGPSVSVRQAAAEARAVQSMPGLAPSGDAAAAGLSAAAAGPSAAAGGLSAAAAGLTAAAAGPSAVAAGLSAVAAGLSAAAAGLTAAAAGPSAAVAGPSAAAAGLSAAAAAAAPSSEPDPVNIPCDSDEDDEGPGSSVLATLQAELDAQQADWEGLTPAEVAAPLCNASAQKKKSSAGSVGQRGPSPGRGCGHSRATRQALACTQAQGLCSLRRSGQGPARQQARWAHSCGGQRGHGFWGDQRGVCWRGCW